MIRSDLLKTSIGSKVHKMYSLGNKFWMRNLNPTNVLFFIVAMFNVYNLLKTQCSMFITLLKSVSENELSGNEFFNNINLIRILILPAIVQSMNIIIQTRLHWVFLVKDGYDIFCFLFPWNNSSSFLLVWKVTWLRFCVLNECSAM